MKLSIKEKAGYGLGDTASNFVWALMMNFIMFFYTDIFGITAAAAGTMLLFARCTDGVVDFLIGAVADRTHSKWGRFRPYLIWMCLPLAGAFILTFTTPDWSAPSKLVYAWVTYNLLMLSYSAINIPYGALSGVMTDDPHERTSLNAYRMSLAQVGGLIANTSFIALIAKFGGNDRAAGAQWTVILFASVAVVLFLITFFTTTERIHPAVGQKTRLRDDIRTLFSNRHWRVVVAAGIISMTFMVIRGTDTIYYLEKYLGWRDGDHDLIAAFWFLGGVAMIVGAMLTRFAILITGSKKRAYIGSMVLMGVFAIPFYWFAPGHTALVFAFHLAGAIVGGINATLFWSLVADTADYAEWQFKVRTTGIIFSAMTCAQKIGMGIGAAAAGFILSHFHYDAKTVHQGGDALDGIVLMMSVIPAAGYFVVAALFGKYGLTDHVCGEIRRDLGERRAARERPGFPP
jgi:GPH family glycoside/pentoside/hexuronide:cation symporter